MPREKRLRLNNQESLPPGSNSPCQEHQQESILFRTCWSFDLSPQDDQLLPEEGILCHQFDFSASKVHDRSGQKRGMSWFCPCQKALLQEIIAEGDQMLGVLKNMRHE
jgi:hypothetical protein